MSGWKMASFSDFGVNDSSVATASPYETYLDQITSLQTDLTKMFSVVETLTADNEQLTEKLQTSQTENAKFREKYNDMRSRYYQENQEKTEIANKHEEIVRAWKIQCEQKAAEIDKMQAKIGPPRDLDLLRMKILEELEVPHQQKVRRLNEDVEKYRTLFYNVRREHELLKTEFEQYTIDRGKREEASHAATSLMVQAMKEKIATLEITRDDTTLTDRVRLLTREMKEMQIKEEQLKAEVSTLSRQKQEATVEMERTVLKSHRSNTELSASAQVMEARALSAEANVHNYKLQYERAQRRTQDQQKRIAELEADLSRQRHAVEVKEEAIADEQAKSSDALQKVAQDCDSKIVRSQVENQKLQREISKLQQALQAAQAKVDSAKQMSEEHAGAIRREVEDLQEHFRKEREELEAKIEAANMSAREAHEHKADIMGRSKADQEELKSMKKKLEQEIVRREKDAAVHKEELKRLMDDIKAREDSEHELREEYGKLQAQHREARAKEQALLTEHEKMESEIEYHQNEVAKLHMDEESVRATHLADLESQRAQFLSEFKNLKREMKNQDLQHRKVVAGLKQDIKKQQTKSEEYKKKAVAEHRKLGQVKSEFSTTKTQFESAKRSLEVELGNTKQRLREVERSRELLMIGGDVGTENGMGTTLEAATQDDAERQQELSKYLERLEKL